MKHEKQIFPKAVWQDNESPNWRAEFILVSNKSLPIYVCVKFYQCKNLTVILVYSTISTKRKL